MKTKMLSIMIAAIAVFCLSGCAVGLVAQVYTDVTVPTAATSNKVGNKVGESSATNILGIFATGDAGINTAAKNGHISSISHVDTHFTKILGFFVKQTTQVYGE